MLYFITRPNGLHEKVFGWHVGEKLPEGLPRVLEIQADGDELDVILKALRSTWEVNQIPS